MPLDQRPCVSCSGPAGVRFWARLWPELRRAKGLWQLALLPGCCSEDRCAPQQTTRPPCPQQAGRASFAPLPAPPLQAAGSRAGPVSPDSASDSLTHAFPLGSSEVLLLTPSPGRAAGAAVCGRAYAPLSAGSRAHPWLRHTPLFRPGVHRKPLGSGLVEPRRMVRVRIPDGLCRAWLEEAWGRCFSQRAALYAP